MPPGNRPMRLLWAAALVAMPLAAGYRFARKAAIADRGNQRCDPDRLSDSIYFRGNRRGTGISFAGFFDALGVADLRGLWISAGFIAPASKDSPLRSVASAMGAGDLSRARLGLRRALVYSQRLCPPLATDALTYHLPAAVFWLQKRRIVLFQTWFFNPANTYSPLAGSMFMTWLLAADRETMRWRGSCRLGHGF